MNFTDNNGSTINVGEKIEWTVTVFKSKYDSKINVDKPLVMKQILTLELVNNENFTNELLFKNEHHSGWDWAALHKTDSECFHVSIIKVI